MAEMNDHLTLILNLFLMAFINRIERMANSDINRTRGNIASLLNIFSPVVASVIHIVYGIWACNKLKLLPSNVTILESPWPIRMLKIGPAIVAVTAISPKPFLVMAVSALMSPRLFPQAKTVKESKACGSYVMKPKMMMRSTTQFEVQLIHAIAIKKARNAYKVNKLRGA